jgi:hypothetical protein
MTTRKNDATLGRVYGGDTGLIHIADGQRRHVGARIAVLLDSMMRADARIRGDRTDTQADRQDLCPGCYMVALFNACVELAQRNNQSLRELGTSMAAAFQHLADNPNATAANIEHIGVLLDPLDPSEGMDAREWENYALAQLLVNGGAVWTL